MASGNKNQGQAQRPVDLSPESIDRLIQVQSHDIEVRRSEVQLRMQELQHTSAHAEKILGAQERDREASRVHERKRELVRAVFGLILSAAVISVVICAMVMGKDALAERVIICVTSIICGALGGYGVGSQKAKEPSDE